jgi:hypothetical protein
VFGASQTRFVGTVSNIFRPSDVAGVYGAANAGAAVVVGGGVIALTNDKGAVLHLSGRQVGLIADLDLSGMARCQRDLASCLARRPVREARTQQVLRRWRQILKFSA